MKSCILVTAIARKHNGHSVWRGCKCLIATSTYSSQQSRCIWLLCIDFNKIISAVTVRLQSVEGKLDCTRKVSFWLSVKTLRWKCLRHCWPAAKSSLTSHYTCDNVCLPQILDFWHTGLFVHLEVTGHTHTIRAHVLKMWLFVEIMGMSTQQCKPGLKPRLNLTPITYIHQLC